MSDTDSGELAVAAVASLVQYFSLMDSFHCFLSKTKLVCTLTRLRSMMGSAFSLNKLRMLLTLCPHVLEIVLLPTANQVQSGKVISYVVTKDNDHEENNDEIATEKFYPHLELVFLMEGTRKGAIAQRLKDVALSCERYCVSCYEKFLLNLNPGEKTKSAIGEWKNSKGKKKRNKSSKNDNILSFSTDYEWHHDFVLKMPSLAPLPLKTSFSNVLSTTAASPSHKNPMSLTANQNSDDIQLDELPSMSSPGSVAGLLERLKLTSFYVDQIKHIEKCVGRAAKYAVLAKPLHPILAQAFKTHLSGDVTEKDSSNKPLQLYSHQVLAVDALRDGKHVTISTPTASGKSLVYNLPVMESIFLENNEATALYIYPTKALAQDQFQGIDSLINRIEKYIKESSEILTQNSTISTLSTPCESDSKVCVVDGDTSFTQRRYAQKHGRILLTNPDMLSCTLLPYHSQWKRFFKNVRYVVIDEAHMYKGVFGSHVSAVMRRLTRVCLYCRQQGFSCQSPPPPLQFIVSSATLADPINHMTKLVPIKSLWKKSTGKVLVDVGYEHRNYLHDVINVDSSCDGSPSGDRYFVLWNPPHYVNSGNDGASSETEGCSTISYQNDMNNLLKANFNPLQGAENVITSPNTISDVKKEGSQAHQRETLIDSRKHVSVSVKNVKDSGAGGATYSACNFGPDGIDSSVKRFLLGCEDGSWSVGKRYGAENRSQRKRKKAESSLEEVPKITNFSRSACPDTTRSPLPPGRVSSIYQTALLFTALVKEQRRVLAFCKSRKLVELVLQYSSRLLFQAERPDLLQTIAGYRGGYTKEQRRDIERRLFDGSMLGLTTTNALELGIDVGSLDATIHLGVPSSQSSLAQQAGRCGRGHLMPEALSIIVCFDSPVDQYYANHPEELFNRPTEQAPLQEHNPYVLRSHLLCAADEIPLNSIETLSEEDIWGTGYHDAIQFLQCDHLSSSANPKLSDDDSNGSTIDLNSIRQNSNKDHPSLIVENFPADMGSKSSTKVLKIHPFVSKPAREVNIRVCDPAVFQVVVDTFASHGTSTNDVYHGSNCVLGSVEYSRAFYELHEGAIYLHQGRQYLVTRLCLDSHIARCILVRVPYHTAAHNDFQIDILRHLYGKVVCGFGIVTVKSTVSGYAKVYRDAGNGSRVTWGGDCSLPQLEYDTCSVWFNIPLPLRQLLSDRLDGSVHAANHALLAAVSLSVDCDIGDIDCEHFESKIMRESSPSTIVVDKNLPHVNEKTDSPIQSQSPDIGETIGMTKLNTSRLLLYDKNPGGTGACEAVFEHIQAGLREPSICQFLDCALNILRDCSCYNGCPSCLFSASCSTHNSTFDKSGAEFLLKETISLLRDEFNAKEGITPFNDCISAGFVAPSSVNMVNSAGVMKEKLHAQDVCSIEERAANAKRLHVHVSTAMEPARKRNIVIKKDWNETHPQFVSSKDC